MTEEAENVEVVAKMIFDRTKKLWSMAPQRRAFVLGKGEVLIGTGEADFDGKTHALIFFADAALPHAPGAVCDEKYAMDGTEIYFPDIADLERFQGALNVCRDILLARDQKEISTASSVEN